jgi:hypothetical protein
MCNRTINTIASGGLNLALGLDKKKKKAGAIRNPAVAHANPNAAAIKIPAQSTGSTVTSRPTGGIGSAPTGQIPGF